MGVWINIVSYHDCQLPDTNERNAGKGSIWKCDCGQNWEITERIGPSSKRQKVHR